MCHEISFGSVDEVWISFCSCGSLNNPHLIENMSVNSNCSEVSNALDVMNQRVNISPVITEISSKERIMLHQGDRNASSGDYSMDTFYGELYSSYNLPQIDGNISEDGNEDVSKIFAINIDKDQILQLTSFFRSFKSVWQSFKCHQLCDETLHVKCFFCCMRSSYLRLNAMRRKGPKSLKLVEMLLQLNQLETILDWKWKENTELLSIFIEKILLLLQHYEKQIPKLFRIPRMNCLTCGENDEFEFKLMHEISTSHLEHSLLTFDIQMILDLLVYKDKCNDCSSKLKTLKKTRRIFPHLRYNISVKEECKTH